MCHRQGTLPLPSACFQATTPRLLLPYATIMVGVATYNQAQHCYYYYLLHTHTHTHTP